MDRALAVFGILIGLAGAAISLIGLNDDALKNYPLVADHRPAILLVSLGMGGLSAVILVLAWLSQAKDLVLSLWEKAQGCRPPELSEMQLTDISEGQLSIAYTYIKEAMSDEGVTQVLSFDQFRSMWQVDKLVYGILWDRREPTALRIVGFISIFPLNKEAAANMLACRLRGSELRAEHLARGRDRPTAYFIGAMAASSWKAKAEIVRLLDCSIADLKLRNENPLLLTSPFTSRGRMIARKFGFRRLREYPGYGELWRATWFGWPTIPTGSANSQGECSGKQPIGSLPSQASPGA